MNLVFTLIEHNHFEELQEFENEKLKLIFSDEIEQSLQRWNSRWRPEAMEHYLKAGWSFMARNLQNQLMGYFLAQPLLFIDGQTQSLWVEHISFVDHVSLEAVAKMAVQLSRDKHFQKIYFPQLQELQLIFQNQIKISQWNPQVFQILTTKAGT